MYKKLKKNVIKRQGRCEKETSRAEKYKHTQSWGF